MLAGPPETELQEGELIWGQKTWAFGLGTLRVPMECPRNTWIYGVCIQKRSQGWRCGDQPQMVTDTVRVEITWDGWGGQEAQWAEHGVNGPVQQRRASAPTNSSGSTDRSTEPQRWKAFPLEEPPTWSRAGVPTDRRGSAAGSPCPGPAPGPEWEERGSGLTR